MTNALHRREGELAYQQGSLPAAGKALKAALAAEPLNPFVASNLACVQYRQAQRPAALTAWQAVEGAVPEAALNLGIDAQEVRKDYGKAVEEYRKYVVGNGPRTTLVKEWIERLESIYGGGESLQTAEGREGAK